MLTPNHHPVNKQGLAGWFAYMNTGSISDAVTWIDKSTSNNDGTLVGDAFIDANGLNIDGTGDLETVPDSDDWFFSTNDFAISMWVYPTSFVGNPALITQLEDGNNFWIFNVNTSGYPIFENYASGYTIQLLATSGLTLNTWNHVAISRTGNNFIIYVDASSVLDTTSTGAVSQFTGALGVGGVNNGSQLLTGKIDNIQIYKGGSLTQTQITAIYNAGRTGNIPSTIDRSNLVLWQSYTFSGIPGLWKDYSGNGSDGTLVSDAFVDNQGANFNSASDDHINCPIVYSGSSARTVSFNFFRTTTPSTEEIVYFSGSIASGEAFGFSLQTNGDIRFNGWGASFDDDVSGYSYQNRWVRVDMVYTGTNKIMYLDSVEYVNRAVSLATGTDGHKIGSSVYIPDPSYFNGKVANIQIYNRTLSAGEIKQNYLKNLR